MGIITQSALFMCNGLQRFYVNMAKLTNKASTKCYLGRYYGNMLIILGSTMNTPIKRTYLITQKKGELIFTCTFHRFCISALTVKSETTIFMIPNYDLIDETTPNPTQHPIIVCRVGSTCNKATYLNHFGGA